MKENVKKQVVNFIKVFTVFTIFVSLIVSLGAPKSAISIGGGGGVTVCPLPYGVNVKYVDTDGTEIDNSLNTFQRILNESKGVNITFEQKSIENYVYKGYYYSNAAGTIVVGSQTKLVTTSTSVLLNGLSTNGDYDPDRPEVDCLTNETFISVTYNVFMVYETVAADKYTVTYDANGGTGTVTDATQYDANTDATIKASTGMTKTGFEFEAWNTAADGSGTTYAPNATLTMTANVTLFAQWKAVAVDKYTITYDANGGTGTIIDNNLYDANTDAMIKSANGFSRAGYTFKHWTTTADGSGNQYFSIGTLKYRMTSNVTFYAQWKLNTVVVDKYTVTYDANGGTGTVTDATQYDANTDATIKASTGMSKTGFEFEAWNTAADGSGTTYAPNATLTMTSNVTLFAQWKAVAVEKYTVTYDANGGTGTVTDATQYDANTDATIKASTGLTKTGFEFEAWNTAADGSGTTYAANATLTMTANVTLFAQWKAVVGAVEQYTITYDANGGTGTVTDATQYDANTDAIVKASTGMTKTGFEFVSWNTVADGSGTTYAADGVITMTSNITLFAQWKAVPVTPDPITPTTPTTPTKLPQTGDNSAIYLIELLLGLGVLIGSKVVIGKKF